jgi:hypothetical protein
VFVSVLCCLLSCYFSLGILCLFAAVVALFGSSSDIEGCLRVGALDRILASWLGFGSAIFSLLVCFLNLVSLVL